ncbi:MAG: YihY/virulence factor BrkB family protein [Pyrinomonadaceae bacterium]
MEFPFGSFFSRLYQKAFEDHIFDSAAQVGFYFSFALFPLLLFLVSLVGVVLGATDEYQRELYFYLSQVMPPAAFGLVKKTVTEVTLNSTGGKITIGLAIALWSASAGIDSLRIALNRVYGYQERRPWVATRSIAVVLTFALTILVSAALFGVFRGWQIVLYVFDSFGYSEPGPFLLVAIQWLTTIAILLVIFELLYNVLPDRRPFRWKWITPGASVGISLWLVLSMSWKAYLSYFDNYDRIYGSIGAGIVLMLWLYLTALAILIGGMVNSILHEISDERLETEETPDVVDVEGDS